MKAPKPATITFRAKVRQIQESDGTCAPYIDYKRNVTRADCNLKPHEHDYYNSDLFVSMLRGAYRRAIGGREWVRLSALPSNVIVDTSKFLAVVTVTIEV